MDAHGLYSLFDHFWVKETRDGPTFSENNFGVDTNYRLIKQNACYLVLTYVKKMICTFFRKHETRLNMDRRSDVPPGLSRSGDSSSGP